MEVGLTLDYLPRRVAPKHVSSSLALILFQWIPRIPILRPVERDSRLDRPLRDLHIGYVFPETCTEVGVSESIHSVLGNRRELYSATEQIRAV